jgi:hypothetical protein
VRYNLVVRLLRRGLFAGSPTVILGRIGERACFPRVLFSVILEFRGSPREP